MSNLANRVNDAIAKNKSIWCHEEDGSLHHLTVPGNTVKVVDGEGGGYIEVTNGDSTILYNLSKIKAIRIDSNSTDN